MNGRKFLATSLILVGVACLYSQAPVKSAATTAWTALSAPALDSDKWANVENVEIFRDRVRITLTSGTFQLLKPVNGVSFGGIFHGLGRIQADPPNSTEEQQLRLFTQKDKLDMAFSDATFSFSPGLLDNVLSQVKWQSAPASDDDLYIARLKEQEERGAEYVPRLLKSLMSGDSKRTAFFLAGLKTKDKGWVEFREDAMQPEEIRISRSNRALSAEDAPDIWLSFPAGGRDPRHIYDDPASFQDFAISDYRINTSISENGEIKAAAQATIQPRYSGENILLFSLDSHLRLNAVKDGQGRNLEFFQPRESHGNYVIVALAAASEAGRSEQLMFQYGGKQLIQKVGEGNYFCQSYGWYPSIFAPEPGIDAFAFRQNFDLTFRSPKKYTLVATGSKISESIEGTESVTRWKSDIPLAVAGFAFGDYKTTREMAGNVEISVYTNNQPDEMLKSLQRRIENPLTEIQGTDTQKISRGVENMMRRGAVGNLNVSALGKIISIETANTLNVFQNYFGPYPYKHLAVTNIPLNYGQGWPGLLYLAWLTFLDSTQRNVIGISEHTQITDFFRAHESSHQWWGHRVGWKSYHDQWLSEGFAQFSGMLYVQLRRGTREFLTQLRKDKELLLSGNKKGHRPDSLGPIWMGRRVISSEADPTSYQALIYTKGGLILQMLRSQLSDSSAEDPDRLFKAMLQDYCRTFENKPASTEDFKTMVEKYMTRGMDLDGNHKMDWFFDQYVYGTGIPRYDFRASVQATPDGKTHLKGSITRTGVPEKWKDVIPLYAHVGDKMARLGTIPAARPTEEFDVILPVKVDRVSINDNEDLLAEVKQ